MKREYDFSRAARGKFHRPNAKLRLPRPSGKPDWGGVNGPLCDFIVQETKNTIRAYEAQPSLVTEHANLEHDTARGGYAHRQIFELVQNSADALAGAGDGKSILVRLTEDYLYCADDGAPIDEEGVRALMFSHMSGKRDTSEIGRFGLGFKSVLAVTDAPEFYSRPGSFRFDRRHGAERISAIARAERYPVLRLPIPIDPREASANDEDLRELMTWATNIVRLPLKPGAAEDLATQVKDFPAEFLLFVDHVRDLSLEHGELCRDCTLERLNGEFRLDTGDGSSRWKCFKTTHTLSVEARQDRRSLDDSGDVPIWWAAPLDRLNEPGDFWAFFPTKTASLVAGILNAPWKTNEDRQNLLPGRYNEELLDAAATLVADRLPDLSTSRDPALHLDALPRRHEAGDTALVDRLREHLDKSLKNWPIVPDQTGRLRCLEELSCAPAEVTRSQSGQPALARWEGFDSRPTDWLHHSAFTRDRLARLDRLSIFQATPQATVAKWLEALVEGCEGDKAVAASMAALQVAAAIPEDTRRHKSLGTIVLTQGGTWLPVDPNTVFLPSSHGSAAFYGLIHEAVASDTATAEALHELGIRHVSP